MGTHVERARERVTENPLWIVVALVVVAAGGALVAIAVSRSDKSNASTLVATALPARTTVSALPVIGAQNGVLPTVVTTLPTSPPSAPTATTLTRWTLADGYTLVLSTVPRASGRATALQIAKRALDQGLPAVGVVDTNDYSGLQAGSFLVFSGVYTSSGDASTHVAQAKQAGFASAYPLRITR
jgi:hypothetical protein